MFNLIENVIIGTMVTGVFLGQYDDKASCQSAIRAIYFQQITQGQRSRISKSDLKAIGMALETTMEWQTKYICIPAKKT